MTSTSDFADRPRCSECTYLSLDCILRFSVGGPRRCVALGRGLKYEGADFPDRHPSFAPTAHASAVVAFNGCDVGEQVDVLGQATTCEPIRAGRLRCCRWPSTVGRDDVCASSVTFAAFDQFGR